MIQHEALQWIGEHADKMAPEIIGGFFGYFLHEMQHGLFRRPGRALVRLFRR